MKQIKPPHFSIIAFAMLFHSACGYSASEVKNEPAPQKSTNPINCSQASELIGIISDKKIFTQTPEEFIASTAALIKPIKDETTQATSESNRDIDFSQTQNNWLASAHSSYSMHSKKIFFNQATFQFPPACFKTPIDFINITKSKIGKGFKDLTFPPPDDAVKVLKWSWKDLNINKIRLMQVTASSELYELKVIIDPAPTDP